MSRGLVAIAHITVDAPIGEVWDALVNPSMVSKYLFGATVVSDWKKGSQIAWRGVWKGKPYEDRGTVLEFEPGRILRYTHFSPLSGMADVSENYHTVSIELSARGSKTSVLLTQDNNPNEDSKAHSQQNWEAMLKGLKEVVERAKEAK